MLNFFIRIEISSFIDIQKLSTHSQGLLMEVVADVFLVALFSMIRHLFDIVKVERWLLRLKFFIQVRTD